VRHYRSGRLAHWQYHAEGDRVGKSLREHGAG
jgi:hypothetical protein